MSKVLFLNHTQTHCGVYSFGKRLFDLASKSKTTEYVYRELETKEEYNRFLKEVAPEFIVYNWYPITMSWLTEDMIISNKNTKHYFIFHDGYMRQNFDKYLFSGAIGKDINLPSEKVVVLPRPLLKYSGAYPENKLPTIGSFGFGGWQKGFPDIAKYVAESFDKAIINILMPFAYFGDKDGIETKKIAERCHELNIYPGIELNIKHDFCSDEEVLTFLAGNDLNIFLYVSSNQGLSSVLDFAVSVKRPIALRNDPMFKHLYKDEICVDNFTIKEILEKGITPLQEYYDKWNIDNFANEVDKIYET